MSLTIELGPKTLEVLERVMTKRKPLGTDRVATPEPPSPKLDISCLTAQLAELKELLKQPPKEKESYSVEEVAKRTQMEGVTKYSRFTIRQACNGGRIPGAQKTLKGNQWRIPSAAVRRILNEGLPPPSKGK